MKFNLRYVDMKLFVNPQTVAITAMLLFRIASERWTFSILVLIK